MRASRVLRSPMPHGGSISTGDPNTSPRMATVGTGRDLSEAPTVNGVLFVIPAHAGIQGLCFSFFGLYSGRMNEEMERRNLPFLSVLDSGMRRNDGGGNDGGGELRARKAFSTTPEIRLSCEANAPACVKRMCIKGPTDENTSLATQGVAIFHAPRVRPSIPSSKFFAFLTLQNPL